MSDRRRTTPSILIVPALLCAAPIGAYALPVSTVTDRNWLVLDTNMMPMGAAQPVCLNGSSPTSCPAAATRYGYPFSGWGADRSIIPNAEWIWAPNVTGTTGSAAGASFVFQQTVFLCGIPTGGWIRLAADDSAVVEVNGLVIGTSSRQDVLTYLSVPASALITGVNIIRVTVTNGPNPPSCTSGQYSCNPAGLVLGAYFEDALAAWPECAPGVPAGTSAPRACQPGYDGAASQLCICSGGRAFWGPLDTSGCHPPPPPPTCPGLDRDYAIGEVENLVCPSTPPIGNTSHQCRWDGTWDRELGTCAPPPPVTCLGADGVTTYPVGATETLSCELPALGAPTRTCLESGQFGPTSGTCTVPTAGPNQSCGARDLVPPVRATCPAGTECRPRTTRVCDGWWIFQTCTTVQTVDFFCL